jgi:hypothetical protein
VDCPGSSPTLRRCRHRSARPSPGSERAPRAPLPAHRRRLERVSHRRRASPRST